VPPWPRRSPRTRRTGLTDPSGLQSSTTPSKPDSHHAVSENNSRPISIRRISLADCLEEALRSQRPLADWFAAEREQGVDTIVDTIHAVLADYAPLVDLVAARMPEDPDPLRDVVFILRTGALFPVYRSFSLLEQLKGRVHVPAILFYPGTLDGAAGLRFMGVLDAEHNYRPKIF